MTGYELSRAVAELKRQGKFAEALELFRREKGALLPEAIARNAWLVADMLTVLRKSGHARAGFAFLRTYGISIDETTDERIVVAFAWLLFDLYKRENETVRFNPSAFYEHLRRIVPLLEASDSIYARSVLSALLRKIVKTEKERASVNWAWLERVTALFDPSGLSTECETITVERRGRMRPMELASDRESWYAVRSKALMETGRMEEALAGCRAIMESHPDAFRAYSLAMRILLLEYEDEEGAREVLERAAVALPTEEERRDIVSVFEEYRLEFERRRTIGGRRRRVPPASPD